MSRIAARFAALRQQGRTALVPFITAGDPGKEITVPLMHTLVKKGADIIELGVPFSDPMADGPVIQRASERALLHHTSLHDVLAMVREFRQKDEQTPVVLMGYLNPIEIMGYTEFAESAHDAGVDGVLTVDISPEEGTDFLPAMRNHGLDPIYLLAPTSTQKRIEKLLRILPGKMLGIAHFSTEVRPEAPIFPAGSGRFQDLPAQSEKGKPLKGVVVKHFLFQKMGGGQYDVGLFCRFRHKKVDSDNQIHPAKSLPDPVGVGPG